MTGRRVNAIIEARMGSTRLPGKTMMPIAGKPAIELLIERLHIAETIDSIVLATTTNPEDDVIEQFCRDRKVNCFRGSSDDVLNRVYNAAKSYKTDVVIEVTGDCPLLDPWLIDDCVRIFIESQYDYLSNFIEQSYPPGIDVQIFTFEVLEEMERLAKDPEYREHVTLYILKHPQQYRMHNIVAPPELTYPDWHLELDEFKDYELIKLIYENLYFKDPRFRTTDIIALLNSHPEWLAINRNVHRVWEEVRKD